eukprot:TRINITY_DN4329_c0_g1_i3.p1 TRINITY_DN4329_c0_g1~~TRINITY_DN4329_c0_g1_i3.p1  ORF type:complete len:129 (+),score=23.60 TRINITY_DN4329_c0_g1_i3:282-668(+)
MSNAGMRGLQESVNELAVRTEAIEKEHSKAREQRKVMMKHIIELQRTCESVSGVGMGAPPEGSVEGLRREMHVMHSMAMEESQSCYGELKGVRGEIQEIWARMMNAVNMLNDTRDKPPADPYNRKLFG